MAKRTKYPIHPDFKRWENLNPPLKRAMIPVMQGLMGLLYKQEKSTAELTVERKTIPVEAGTIRALWYCPRSVSDISPCLVVYHGGGFVLPATPYHYSLAKEYAQRAKCKVLFVDYRLAPKNPFPIPPEDCYAAYSWVITHAEEFGIDPARVAVTGDSAGGQLATVVCLMAKDRGQIMPCGQMLIYPAAGDVETESVKKYTDTPCATAGIWISTGNTTVPTQPSATMFMPHPSKRRAWRDCRLHISKRRSSTVCGTAVFSTGRSCAALAFLWSCTIPRGLSMALTLS